jgi:hypothetical protein
MQHAGGWEFGRAAELSNGSACSSLYAPPTAPEVNDKHIIINTNRRDGVPPSTGVSARSCTAEVVLLLTRQLHSDATASLC